MKNIVLLLGLVTIFAFGRVNMVMADSGTEAEKVTNTKEVCKTQYGGQVECTTEETSEYVHGTVNTGLGDNVMVFMLAAAVASLTLMGLAKMTKRVYLLD